MATTPHHSGGASSKALALFVQPLEVQGVAMARVDHSHRPVLNLCDHHFEEPVAWKKGLHKFPPDSYYPASSRVSICAPIQKACTRLNTCAP